MEAWDVKSPFLMGKLTNQIRGHGFKSYVTIYQRITIQ
jgi:hypothetical protein